MKNQALGKSIINEYFHKTLFQRSTGRPCKVPLWKLVRAILYKLCTGIQWKYLPISYLFHKETYSWQSVYYHYNKWCSQDLFSTLFKDFIAIHRFLFDCSILNLDGSHSIAKRGGEKVAYQGRKKASTSNILILTDKKGLPLSCSEIISGNHHDAFKLEKTAAKIFDNVEDSSISLDGLFLNADSGFDTKNFIKLCYEKGVVPNIDFNRRGSNIIKDRMYVFDQKIYKRDM